MALSNVQRSPQALSERPLIVSLAGTLVKSDVALDSLLHLVRHNPAVIVKIWAWMFSGTSSLRSRLENAASLDVEHLPYHSEVLSFLRKQRAQGRSVYLATSSDGRLAQRIVEHLDIFEGKLLFSRDSPGLKDGDRLNDGQPWNPGGDFAFIGHSIEDLARLSSAAERMVANPRPSLLRAMSKSQLEVDRRFEDRVPPLRSIQKAIRLHQWAKNLLLFVPLLLSHSLGLISILKTTAAFLCFSLCASATYIVNDLFDLEADRRHPRKRARPFAAGNLSVTAGMIIIATFLSIGFVGAQLLPGDFAGWLAAYLVATLAYSLVLKRIVLVDVVVLSALYTLRLVAGAAVTRTSISPWLSGFSLFLFLSLAMVKRFSELQNLRAAGRVPLNGRGYLLLDIEALRSFGTASGYASVVVFALYINGHDIMALYKHPNRMWMVAPLLIWWISRFWLLAARGELDEDPVVFALTDRTSMFIGACIAVVGFLAL